MAKRKNNKPHPAKGKKSKPKKSNAPQELDLQAVYAEMRAKFSAADLQKYTEIEEGIPAEQILAEMEEIHRNVSRKRA